MGAGSATRTVRVRTKTPSGAEVRSWMRTERNTPRRVAVCGSRPSAGAAVRHQTPGGSSARTSSLDAFAVIRIRNSTASPTVASVGPTTETLKRASEQMGHRIPTTNNVKAKTPTATTASCPVAAPAATPYAPSVKSMIEVSVRSPGPW